jgi:hypothetical protein
MAHSIPECSIMVKERLNIANFSSSRVLCRTWQKSCAMWRLKAKLSRWLAGLDVPRELLLLLPMHVPYVLKPRKTVNFRGFSLISKGRKWYHIDVDLRKYEHTLTVKLSL